MVEMKVSQANLTVQPISPVRPTTECLWVSITRGRLGRKQCTELVKTELDRPRF